jgi:hypothetical protein
VERGDVMVTVDTDDVSRERLRLELEQLGGRTYGRDPRPASEVDVRRDV